MEPHALGPNGHAVAAFLDRVATMPPIDVDGAVRLWREAQRPRDAADGSATWAAAEDAAAAALVRTERGDVVWSLEERVHDAFRRAPWRRAGGAGFAAVRSETTAQYLVSTAAVALLLADALPARHLATLYAPFRSVVPLDELTTRPPTSPDATGSSTSPSSIADASAIVLREVGDRLALPTRGGTPDAG